MTMRTLKTFAAALATLFVTLLTAGVIDAVAATATDVQSPRAQLSAKTDDAQSPRGALAAKTDDVQSPRGQDSQAPATQDDAQSPRSAR
jgi:hypothetical protein